MSTLGYSVKEEGLELSENITKINIPPIAHLCEAIASSCASRDRQQWEIQFPSTSVDEEEISKNDNNAVFLTIYILFCRLYLCL